MNYEQALAARDFSWAGETFIDFNGYSNKILYSTLTPMGYFAHISDLGFKHIEKHPNVLRYRDDLPFLLNNPDLIVPSYEFPTTHLFYKVVEKTFLVVAVHHKDEIRFVATMHSTPTIKGLKDRMISQANFLYIRGGFKWKKWR